jgi:hypothetical protein
MPGSCEHSMPRNPAPGRRPIREGGSLVSTTDPTPAQLAQLRAVLVARALERKR